MLHFVVAIKNISMKVKNRMNQIIKYLLLPLLTISSPLFGVDKHLILVEGNHWSSMLPKNFIENRDHIEKLPTAGFVMVGESYTNRVMAPDTTVTYQEVWREVKGLKNLYKDKHNFMQINILFPADFWNDEAWSRVEKNFAVVAKVAKDLGFEGIVFDDEAYSDRAIKMANFKFPTTKEIQENPKKYADWERRGAEGNPAFDEHAYRNKHHTFKEHIAMVTQRFKSIMQAMVKENQKLVLLVYNGPSFSHENSNQKNLVVVDMGLPREHEFLGAIYTGFLEGLGADATLHDMGESYRYREDKHFKNAYQWRKYGIAENSFNDNLNSNYHWIVPPKDRASWSKKSNIGFMVFNQGQSSSYKEFDTLNRATVKDIQKTIERALDHSDKYVLFYYENQDWLLPNPEEPLAKGWMEMMKEVVK
jgi:hypothetical protein